MFFGISNNIIETKDNKKLQTKRQKKPAEIIILTSTRVRQEKFTKWLSFKLAR